VYEVNVIGLVRTVRPFVRPMVERGRGRFVLVSSIVGKRGVPHYTAYASSKFAVHGIADCLRSELVGTGVTVGVVCPASTDTEFRSRLEHGAGPMQSGRRLRQHDARAVAGAIHAIATSRRRERVLGLEGKLFVWAAAIAPGLLDRFLARTLMRER
jgi:3-dehydrosphinganine reductase